MPPSPSLSFAPCSCRVSPYSWHPKNIKQITPKSSKRYAPFHCHNGRTNCHVLPIVLHQHIEVKFKNKKKLSGLGTGRRKKLKRKKKKVGRQECLSPQESNSSQPKSVESKKRKTR